MVHFRFILLAAQTANCDIYGRHRYTGLQRQPQNFIGGLRGLRVDTLPEGGMMLNSSQKSTSWYILLTLQEGIWTTASNDISHAPKKLSERIQIDPNLFWTPYVNQIKTGVAGWIDSIEILLGIAPSTFSWPRSFYTAVVCPALGSAAPVYHTPTNCRATKNGWQDN